MAGIVSYSCYVPRYRLNRKLIFKSVGWLDPSTAANARGEKAVANFDEDTITLAVAAAVQATLNLNRSDVDGLYFSSTSLPYKERLNAAIVSGALGLADGIRGADFTGGLKAGTTALLSGLESVAAHGLGKVIVCASDCRLGKPASAEEMIFGDASAAFVLGTEAVIAEYKGSYSLTCDFVDHFRGEFAKFDRKWEDRWIRDMGYNRLIPSALQGLLKKYDLRISDFAKVIYDCQDAASRRKLNKEFGISAEMEQDSFQMSVGHCGTAQSLMMLAAALDDAKPRDKILLLSFGSGCDALYFEVTENIKQCAGAEVMKRQLSKKAELDHYEKYLVWRDILPVNTGLRSEEDLWTRPSVLWRHRKEVLGLCGSRCLACGTPQYPAQRVCVNPACGEIDRMEDYYFSNKLGRIVSYTGDMLAASPNPPTSYGAVEFEGGGRNYFEFTDCNLEDLSPGTRVAMSFRRKYKDEKRGVSGYFWKATPIKEEK
jgi:3-hydroxy-3-methylglutaryl CoA synthase